MPKKVRVLRAKQSLKNNINFSRVYIRSYKSHVERVIELNARTILSELPTGANFRIAGNGRIIHKDRTAQLGQDGFANE